MIATVASSSQADWLGIVVSVVAAAVAVAAAIYAGVQARATRDLTNIEREKLRRLEEPSFRARYEPARRVVAFTMVSGPTDICEVGMVVPFEGHTPYLEMKSPDSLGFMQIHDTRELPAKARHDRPDQPLQQVFLLEVKWKSSEETVSVYCDIPRDLKPLVAFGRG